MAGEFSEAGFSALRTPHLYYAFTAITCLFFRFNGYGCCCTACVFMSLSNTIYGYPRDTSGAVVSLLDRVYNHARDAFLFTIRAIISLPRTITIIQRMRPSYTARAFVDTVYHHQSPVVNNHLRDDAIPLHRSCSCQSIRDGLQSFKGRFSCIARAVISQLGTVTIIQGMPS